MNKFEEIMNGKVQNPTKEQIDNALIETVKGFTSLKDLNEFLTKLHPSDAYVTIRDIVQPKTNIIIKREQQSKTEEYQKFQAIQQEAKKIFEYERKNATILDVQNISNNVAKQFYGITVRMISMMDDELGKIEQAINRIEEHIGIDVTNFNEEEHNNDTTESVDEQGSKETT